MNVVEHLLEAICYAALALWRERRAPIYAVLFALKAIRLLLGR